MEASLELIIAKPNEREWKMKPEMRGALFWGHSCFWKCAFTAFAMFSKHTHSWRMIGECMVGLFTVRNPKYFQVNQYLIWRIMFQLWWGADGTCFNILTLNVHLIRCIWISFINSVRTKMGREGVQHKSLVYISKNKWYSWPFVQNHKTQKDVILLHI